jgi:hypothetical protein
MAKNYVDNLSEETRKGMLEKAEQGLWPSFAPLGYVNAERTILPDAVVAPIIRKIFEWYATGAYSLVEVTKMAKAAGMVFRKSGNPVPKATIHKILHNRIYTGNFDFNGKLYQGRYEPIITRALYQTVQEVLQQRLGRRQKQKHDFAFSGFITCGHCGCSLVGESKKGRYVYYHCTGNKGKCSEPYVREEVLEAEFTKAIRQLAFTDEFLKQAKEALQQSQANERREREGAITRLQAEQTKLQRRLDGMYDDKLDGLIDADIYSRRAAEARAEQARLAEQIEVHQKAGVTFIDNLRALADRAATLFEQQPAHEKRKLLRFVVEKCKWKDGVLLYCYRQPFEALAEPSTGEMPLAA